MSQKHGFGLNGGTVWFEGGPPLEVSAPTNKAPFLSICLQLADRIAAALPYPVGVLFAKREVARVAELDKFAFVPHHFCC